MTNARLLEECTGTRKMKNVSTKQFTYKKCADAPIIVHAVDEKRPTTTVTVPGLESNCYANNK